MISEKGGGTHLTEVLKIQDTWVRVSTSGVWGRGFACQRLQLIGQLDLHFTIQLPFAHRHRAVRDGRQGCQPSQGHS